MAHPLQDRISDFNNNVLLPALAKVCDQLVEPGQRVRIDKLEIDVGRISVDQLENDLQEKVLKQFKNRLQEMVMKNPSLVETIPPMEEISIDEDIEIPPKSYQQLEVFLYFLQYGILPWWHARKTFKMREVADEVFTHSPQLFFKKAVPLLQFRDSRLRLIDKLNDRQILQFIDPGKQTALRTIWKEIEIQSQQGFFSPLTFDKIRRIVFDEILAVITFGERISIKRKKTKIAILQVVLKLQPKLFSRVEKSGKTFRTTITKNRLLFRLTEGLPPDELEKIIKNALEDLTETTEETIAIPANDEEQAHPIQKSVTADGIEINNAGIVLLWPYLELFFKELKLVKKKDFVDENARWKGVHLLHFLAFGDEEAEEQQWVLNKLLCGMQASDFVPSKFTIHKTEKAECNNLLQSVIKNWPVLKNTSVPALRSAFLQRNGLLKNDAQGYIVEIEKTAIDVLLDKLSWPLSVIKLPWNRGLIHVKW